MTTMLRPCLTALFLSLLLSPLGCSRAKTTDSPAPETSQGSSASSDDDDATRSFPGDNAEGISFRDIEDSLNVRVIYFDYDSSTITGQQGNIVEAHSRFLVANPEVRVTLEGHADERGSREYNLALGERRAIAVKRQFVLLGVAEQQILAKSYGEERPAAQGSNELAWQQNRRVEIIY